MCMRLENNFFKRDCLEVAPQLVGKLLLRRLPDGTIMKLRINETEAYRGETDTACHANKGRTKRTNVLYREGSTIYVYLCYGIHWLLNFVTGEKDHPQAVLVRSTFEAPGPGRLTKKLLIDGSFNGLDITDCENLWIEDDGTAFKITTDTRVGIDYALPEDREKLWRFKADMSK